MSGAVKNPGIAVPDEIRRLVPYAPGKPMEELERELGIKDSIKLASNENPLGPSKKAMEAIRAALPNLHRYPDGSCFYLKRKLAAFLSAEGIMPVDESMLVIGNGSNEIIELLVKTFLRKGDEAIMGDPSFAVYPIVVDTVGAKAVKIPLDGSLTIDLDRIAKAITPGTKLIFISNPNNPTGTIVKKAAVERLLDRVPSGALVCMDEAYCEYVTDSDFPDSLKYVKEGRPVVVLRTFSKIYGLAGLRVGYGVAHPEIADYLNRVRQPFNVNTLAQLAAAAALDDTAHVELSKKTNVEGLKYLFGELKKLGFETVPTEANFFLVKVGDGEGVYNALLRKGVIVRPMKSYSLPAYIRVTVGTPQENSRFVSALREATGK